MVNRRGRVMRALPERQGMTTSSPGGTTEIGEFFDQQLEMNHYSSLKAMTRELDLAAARILEEEVAGDVLSIGGVWDWFEWTPVIASLTVLDLSPRVLDAYCPAGAARVEGDLFEIEFPPRGFDSVVFPLVLHHTPRDDWATSQRRVRDALARAYRWLRPGGKVVVVEYCSQSIWAAAQRVALPVTKRFLRHFGQPLVVMQTRRFYETSLTEHFDHVAARQPQPEGFNYWKWYPVFMGVRWLRVPLAVYPRLHVFTAERHRPVTDIDQSSSSKAAHNGDGVGN
jgi:SAM-dependent methyltransferase